MSANPAAPSPAIDATQCPMCGQPNRCAMETARETGKAQPPCWCMNASFSPALLGAVPGPARGVACICSACAARARANQKENTA